MKMAPQNHHIDMTITALISANVCLARTDDHRISNHDQPTHRFRVPRPGLAPPRHGERVAAGGR
jgi:hypothetical protein